MYLCDVRKKAATLDVNGLPALRPKNSPRLWFSIIKTIESKTITDP